VGSSAGQTSQGADATAVGYLAGQTSQGTEATAVGVAAGRYNQGTQAVAVGYYAGLTSQGAYAVAVGRLAGETSQGTSAVAVGRVAGETSQGDNAVAVGYQAGYDDQGTSAVAVGYLAGQTSQGAESVAIGDEAGQTNQGSSAVAIGEQCGQVNQGDFTVAVGYLAGENDQGDSATAVGLGAGRLDQGSGSVAVGFFAGYDDQGAGAVAVGWEAGSLDQGAEAVAVGYLAGYDDQGIKSVALGYEAGKLDQGAGAVAVGYQAGYDDQGVNSVAIGHQAGRDDQSSRSVAIGRGAGYGGQERYCVAIGDAAGATGQGCFSTAVGMQAGESAQGTYAVAVGYLAGQTSQGTYSIAVGYAAGQTSQPPNSFFTRYASVRAKSGVNYTMKLKDNGEIMKDTSDDRLKNDEKFITGAVKSLCKLRPQEYLKRQDLDANVTPQGWSYEAGLMAQEVYYSAPELRHIVMIPPEAGDIDNYTPPPSDDPTQDPDYSVWGNGLSTVDYNQLTPYLVKAVQEIVTELPRSKTTVSNTWGQNISGLVVSANENAHKTNVTPIVALSNVNMDKAWYGIVSDKTIDTNDYDTLVDTKGDTQIWVTDIGGPLESGDLLTTSNVSPGFTQKQSDDIVRNYTVAKVTQDCDFTTPTQHTIKVPKRELSNVTYYRHDSSWATNLEKYEEIVDFKKTTSEELIYFKEVTEGSDDRNETRYYQGDTEVSEKKYNTLPENDRTIKYLSELRDDEYDNLSVEDKATYSLGTYKVYKVKAYSQSKNPLPQHDEEIVIEELVDVLDANGQIVWEDTTNTVPAYTLVDHGTYKAALVSCKLI